MWPRLLLIGWFQSYCALAMCVCVSVCLCMCLSVCVCLCVCLSISVYLQIIGRVKLQPLAGQIDFIESPATVLIHWQKTKGTQGRQTEWQRERGRDSGVVATERNSFLAPPPSRDSKCKFFQSFFVRILEEIKFLLFYHSASSSSFLEIVDLKFLRKN